MNQVARLLMPKKPLRRRISALKRKPKKPETTVTPQEKIIPQSAPVRSNGLSRAKKWVFSIVGFVLVPLLLLALVELGLRVAGYGYSPHFFKRIKKINEDFLVEHDKFGLRFFPPELARSL